MQAVLILPDPAERSVVEDSARQAGFEVACVADADAAFDEFANVAPDVLIASLEFVGDRAAELVDLGKPPPRTEVVLVVDPPRVKDALGLLRHGVSDFLERPIRTARLLSMLSHLRRVRSLAAQLDDSRTQLETLGRFGRFVGASQPMREVYRRIGRIAPADSSVLVAGESGTGKEMVARSLHEMSPRRHESFCAVNCGAIAGDLLESELFGHERGAFTGADRSHAGWFERAHGGTLFLDEITEMPAEAQVSLLRVLETGSVRRVGGEDHRDIEVRVVAATNQNVEEAVESGRLREDLYYRLAVFRIWIPPLRDRGGDVDLLARYFLDAENREQGGDKRFDPGALQRLADYSWPGNVRELRNAVRSAWVLADDVIDAASLPQRIVCTPGDTEPGSFLRVRIGSPLADAERRLILATLARFEGNKTRTAEALGIAVKTLYNRLARYDSEPN